MPYGCPYHVIYAENGFRYHQPEKTAAGGYLSKCGGGVIQNEDGGSTASRTSIFIIFQKQARLGFLPDPCDRH